MNPAGTLRPAMPERLGRPSSDIGADMYRAVKRIVLVTMLFLVPALAIWWHNG